MSSTKKKRKSLFGQIFERFDNGFCHEEFDTIFGEKKKCKGWEVSIFEHFMLFYLIF